MKFNDYVASPTKNWEHQSHASLNGGFVACAPFLSDGWAVGDELWVA